MVGFWKPRGALAFHVDSPAGMLALYSVLRAILVYFTEVSVDPCPVSIVSFWWSHLQSVALFLCPLSISTLIALVLTFIFLLPSKSPCSGPNGLPASVLFPPDLCPHCSHCSSVKSRCPCLSFTSPMAPLARARLTETCFLLPPGNCSCYFCPAHSSLLTSSHSCPIFLVNSCLSILMQLKYHVWAAGLTLSRQGESFLLSARISLPLISYCLDCFPLSGQRLHCCTLCAQSLAYRRDSISVTGIGELSARFSAGHRVFLTFKVLAARKLIPKHNWQCCFSA